MIRYPDEVYLQQVVEFVDNAAKAAALSTGTKVKIDHYGKDWTASAWRRWRKSDLNT